MKQGHTKQVLEAQIEKYDKLLSGNNDKITTWLYNEFTQRGTCPVCRCRWFKYARCISGVYENCLAMNKQKMICADQEWYKTLNRIQREREAKENISTIRRILKSRLKYWQRIYAEKYPVKS